VALLLILHELTTNATKYGALSRTEGKLAVTWLLEDGDGGPRIRLRWAEAGGPPVAPPSRRGFGTTLIERGAPYELGGSAKLDFRESGLCCELSFPVPPAEKIE
jgi:two-component sensor histidine kinase